MRKGVRQLNSTVCNLALFISLSNSLLLGSAANQALRVYSYLNRTSMRAIQAMLLMSYFLMNDNHASDAYAWAGIHLRQSYAMRSVLVKWYNIDWDVC
jgi:hypothetical protein